MRVCLKIGGVGFCLIAALIGSTRTGMAQTPAATPADRTTVLRRLSEQGRNEAARGRARESKPLSAAEKRRIAEAQKPDPIVVQNYADLLKRRDAKLVRLHPDFGCEMQHTVSVTADCSDRIVGASKFALRGSGFTPDIHYDFGEIVGIGFFNLILLADLGDLSFDDVSPNTPTVRALASFEPPKTYSRARQAFRDLTKEGVTVDGVTFKDRVGVGEGSIIALRVIAFDTKDMSGFLVPSNAAPEFQELRWDGRRDVVIVAKVVGRSPDGILHLLWREMTRRSAPSIRFEEGDPPIDFRTKGN